MKPKHKLLARALTMVLLSALMTCVSLSQKLWTSGGVMPYSIARAEAVVHDSDLYLLGGYSDSLNGFPFVQRFRPGNGWSLAGAFRPRMDFVAASDSDRIYCLGGTPAFMGGNPHEDPSIDTLSFGAIGRGEQYDADSTFRRISSTGLIYKGVFYLFGGVSRDPGPYVLEYKLRTHDRKGYGDRHVVSGQMSARIGENIFLFGGVAAGVTKTIVRYNTVSHTLSVMPLTLLRPRAFGKAIHCGESDSIMIMGGIDENNHPLNTVEVFVWPTGQLPSVHPAPKMHFARSHFSAAEFNGSIYVFGGLDDPQRGSTLNSVEVFSTVNGVGPVDPVGQPNSFSLNQNYPNPFNPSTNIAFSVTKTAHFRLDVYTVAGIRVQTILNESLSPGEHTATWNGMDSDGLAAPSGVYFYRLNGSNETITRKMILAR